MAQAWRVVDRAETADGTLELRRRGPGDVLLTIDGRVLMNSRANRSELALARLACRNLPNPRRVLIGGLGLGLTLRAALDDLPPHVEVTVVEIHPKIVDWCRTHLSDLHGAALDDPRVRVRIDDVANSLRAPGSLPPHARFDAILLDLYEGPSSDPRERRHPIYGSDPLAATWSLLPRGGRFAVWGEQPCPPFAKRLRAAGFDVQIHRPGQGGLRHVVYLGVRRPTRDESPMDIRIS